MKAELIGAAGLLATIFGLILIWHQRCVQARHGIRLRDDMERNDRECRRQIDLLRETLATSESNAQASLELLRDGRLGMAARARALRMLRSGMAADTAAAELGLARNEIRLLEKVAILLAPVDRHGEAEA